MKQITSPLLILSLITIMIACDTSFLDENKKIKEGYVLEYPLFVVPTNVLTEMSILIPELKNKDFKVVQYPTIFQFETLRGSIDSNGNLSLKIKVDDFQTDISREPHIIGEVIFDIEEFGFLLVTVMHHNYGNPKLELNRVEIDFDRSRVPETFSVTNTKEGYLFFTVTDYPDWLEVKTSDNKDAKNQIITLHQHGKNEMIVSRKDENLSPGVYEGGIIIESNDAEKLFHTINVKITVREKKNPDNIIAIEGNVIDCVFNKELNQLYIATNDLNKVYVFDVSSSEITREITFNHNVYGVSLSEDNKTLFVGQSGLVSCLNANTLAIESEIEIDFIATHVVDGLNGYYYISKHEADYRTYFYTYSIATGELSPSGSYIDNMEGSSLTKLLNQPFLLTTRYNTSPNGLTLASIADGRPKNLLYWHQTFGDKLWQKEDGSIVTGRNGSVFKTPSVNTKDPIHSLGVLKPSNLSRFSDYYYRWIDLNINTGSIWGVYYHPLDENITEPTVIEWDDNSYQLKRYISYEDYYTTIKGVTDFYETMPLYLFTSKKGDTLVLIKNIKDKGDWYHPVTVKNAWHLEIIDVSN